MEAKKNPRPAMNEGTPGYTPDYTSSNGVLHEPATPDKYTVTARKRAEYELLCTMAYELSWDEARRVAERVERDDFTNLSAGVVFGEIVASAAGFVEHGHGDKPVSLTELSKTMTERGVMDHQAVRDYFVNLALPGQRPNGRYRLSSLIDQVVAGALRYRMSQTFKWDDCLTAPLDVLIRRYQGTREALNTTYARLNSGAPGTIEGVA